MNESVSIRLLLRATSYTTFNAYPQFTDNSISQKIEQFKGTNDKIIEDFLAFFKKLNSAVSDAIEKTKCA